MQTLTILIYSNFHYNTIKINNFLLIRFSLLISYTPTY